MAKITVSINFEATFRILIRFGKQYNIKMKNPVATGFVCLVYSNTSVSFHKNLGTSLAIKFVLLAIVKNAKAQTGWY